MFYLLLHNLWKSYKPPGCILCIFTFFYFAINIMCYASLLYFYFLCPPISLLKRHTNTQKNSAVSQHKTTQNVIAHSEFTLCKNNFFFSVYCVYFDVAQNEFRLRKNDILYECAQSRHYFFFFVCNHSVFTFFFTFGFI